MIAGPLTLVRRDRTILLLAVAGGSLDAVILLVFNVLTAAQTGNTIILAISLARGQLATGLLSAVSVVGYVVGTGLAELILLLSWDDKRASPSRPWALHRALTIELVLIGCLLVLWYLTGPHPVGGMVFILVGVAAVAMGIQSVVVLYLHVGPATTYITGTLTLFMIEAIRWLRLGPPRLAIPTDQHNSYALRVPPELDPRNYGITWITYLMGALVSALLYFRIGEWSLVVPIAAVAAVVLSEGHDWTE